MHVKNKVRVLIVSSEVLNPEQTYPSIFELAQAQILRQCHEVAILSVLDQPPLLRRLKISLVTSTIASLKNSSGFARDLLKVVLKVKNTRCHCIEGIQVFEGIMESFRSSPTDFLAHTNSWCEAAIGAYERYCKAVGVPDLIHAHGRFLLAGEFARKLKAAEAMPFVYTEHSSFYQRKLAPVEAKELVHDVVCAANAFTAVSHAVGKALSAYVGAPLPTPLVVGNVLSELFEKKEAIAPPNTAQFTIVCIASLNANKGVDTLVRAFAALNKSRENVYLKICGDGPQRDMLQVLTKEFGIANQVQFMGQMSSDAILTTIDQSHVLVVSSSVETFGVVVIEALARGRVVVSTRCGGPEELINESNGLLVEQGDVQGMADALEHLSRTYSSFDYQAIRQDCLARHGSAAFLKRMNAIYDAISQNK